MKKAFTLVEVLIVIAILGILAAIILPEYQNHSQLAKEAAAKDSLRVLRSAIELYASQHNDVPPGYSNNDSSTQPSLVNFVLQILSATNNTGQNGSPGTPGYNFGPYLSALAANPFNGAKTIKMINNGVPFPSEPSSIYGWIYKPQTKEIRLNRSGTDSAGVRYFDY